MSGEKGGPSPEEMGLAGKKERGSQGAPREINQAEGMMTERQALISLKREWDFSHLDDQMKKRSC